MAAAQYHAALTKNTWKAIATVGEAWLPSWDIAGNIEMAIGGDPAASGTPAADLPAAAVPEDGFPVTLATGEWLYVRPTAGDVEAYPYWSDNALNYIGA